MTASDLRRGSCALLLALAACEPAASAAGNAAHDLSGPDVPLDGAPADVALIGEEQGEAWEMLSRVRAMTFDDADRLYVVDGGSSSVFVYNADGSFVRQVGRRGDGPGEFRNPSSLVVTTSGELVVTDPGHNALIVFDSAGAYQRNVSWRGTEGGIGWVYEAAPGVLALLGGAGAGEDRQVNVMTLQLPDGAPRTVARLPVPPTQSFDATSGTMRMRIIRTAEYSAETFMGANGRGEVFVQHEAPYRVRVLDLEGNELRTLARPIAPRPVGDAEKQAYERRREEMHAARGAVTPLTALPYDVPFADSMSVVTGMLVDPAGRVWVQRRLDDGAAEGAIDVIGQDGSYIGTLPPQPLPEAVSASGLAAWVVKDEYDVERIAIRRLPETWR